MSTVDEQFDVVVVGGGLVGCSLALALAKQPLKIALLEAKEFTASPPDLSATAPPPDRALALSYASIKIFQTLGVWSQINRFAEPISQVHVSDAGHFGSLRFRAEDFRIPALGSVVLASHLLAILQKNVTAQPSIHSLSSVHIEQLSRTTAGYQLNIRSFQGQQTLTSKLLVVADGSDSKTRKLLGIAVKEIEYREQALFGTVGLGSPHFNKAYERFTRSGPLAFLPLANDRCAFVWTVSPESAQRLMPLADDGFCEQLQAAFGYRLGRLQQLGQRQLYPLRSVFADEQIRSGLVLLGNVAHTIHPVAAQGFNLSLKDTVALAQVIIEAVDTGQSPGELVVLEKYLHWREQEQKAVRWFTDGLINLFSSRVLPIALLRDLGLCGVDVLPFAKKWVARAGMGMLGRLPRPVCGISD